MSESVDWNLSIAKEIGRDLLCTCNKNHTRTHKIDHRLELAHWRGKNNISASVACIVDMIYGKRWKLIQTGLLQRTKEDCDARVKIREFVIVCRLVDFNLAHNEFILCPMKVSFIPCCFLQAHTRSLLSLNRQFVTFNNTLRVSFVFFSFDQI